jgi:ppGpp synthetase/RelA/SpoT-type nucleotidyltranferase
LPPKKGKKSITPEEWGEAFRRQYSVYEDFTDKLKKLISELLRDKKIEVAQIEHRTKTVRSFIDKIQREGKTYANPLEEITDLVGIRIIAYQQEDVDRIRELLEKELDIDWGNSVDKAETLDPDRFGYLSVHYVVGLPPARRRLTEWKVFSSIKAEIQVRTALQHAWAAIDHKLRYKTAKEVPRDLRRKLFCLSALLELADDEFSNLTKLSEQVEAQYSQRLKKGNLDIEVDLSSLQVYLSSTKHLTRWRKEAREIGFRAALDAGERRRKRRSRLLKILQLTGVATIKELDDILSDADSWGTEVLTRFFKLSSEAGRVPTAVGHNLIMILVLYAKRNRVTRNVIFETNYVAPLRRVLTELTKTR